MASETYKRYSVLFSSTLKRVDFSGRSVIAVGPTLKMYQCGVPREMAIELFKPFVMREIVARDIVQNVKAAKRLVERGDERIWDILEEIIKELTNRKLCLVVLNTMNRWLNLMKHSSSLVEVFIV